VKAKVGWFHATDGVLLDGASLGDGSTGIVLAHESPADLCGWLPYAKVLGAAGFRVLAFDHRHFGLSQSPIAAAKCGRFSKDLAGAVAELEREGAKKVFLMGASFGGITSMVSGSRLGSKTAGVISVSGEEQLANRCGPAAELDAKDAVPRLRTPFLIIGSREDSFLPPSDACAPAASRVAAQAARPLPGRGPRLGHPRERSLPRTSERCRTGLHRALRVGFRLLV
jgi:pimeloyl-ACP methyl ester carboxylesterase